MKRAAITIMVCLLLGAIINVAVAWGVVLWTPPMLLSNPSPIGIWPVEVPDDWPPADGIESAQRLGIVFLRTRGDNIDQTFRHLEQQFDEATERAFAMPDPASRSRALDEAVNELSRSRRQIPVRYASVEVLKSGLPVSCVYSERSDLESISISAAQTYRVSDESKQGLAIPAWIPWCEHEKRNTRRLPTRIMPLGFTVNTLVYAGLIAIIVWACAFLRRRCRVREGCCTACGYDLRGAAHERCPECGTATASALRHSDRCAAPRTAGL